MSDISKGEKPSSDISKVTDGLNAFDALKAAAKAIANESPEILTGVLATVLPPVLPLVRIFHAGAKNNLIKQVVVEIEELRKKGAISEEYLKKDEAHACFADLLDAIDKNSPDPKRYEAMRLAFLKAMKHGETGKSGAHAQQLLRLIYGLSAGEIVILATIYRLGTGTNTRVDSWLHEVANESGMLRGEIVEGIEQTLMEKRLILPRVPATLTSALGVEHVAYGSRNRLTTLGEEVCENIKQPQS